MSGKLKYRLIVTLIVFGSLALLFFATMGLINPVNFLPSHEQPLAANIYAQYMASRNIAFVLVIIGALILKAKQALGFLLILNGIIQAFDSIIGLVHQNTASTVAPMILSVLFLISGRYLLKK